jgi:hypothetical protein
MVFEILWWNFEYEPTRPLTKLKNKTIQKQNKSNNKSNSKITTKTKKTKTKTKNKKQKTKINKQLETNTHNTLQNRLS